MTLHAIHDGGPDRLGVRFTCGYPRRHLHCLLQFGPDRRHWCQTFGHGGPEKGIPRDPLDGFHEQLSQAYIADPQGTIFGALPSAYTGNNTHIDKRPKPDMLLQRLLKQLLRLVLLAEIHPVRRKRWQLDQLSLVAL
jgi:hypothetical protein